LRVRGPGRTKHIAESASERRRGDAAHRFGVKAAPCKLAGMAIARVMSTADARLAVRAVALQ